MTAGDAATTLVVPPSSGKDSPDSSTHSSRTVPATGGAMERHPKAVATFRTGGGHHPGAPPPQQRHETEEDAADAVGSPAVKEHRRSDSAGSFHGAVVEHKDIWQLPLGSFEETGTGNNNNNEPEQHYAGHNYPPYPPYGPRPHSIMSPLQQHGVAPHGAPPPRQAYPPHSYPPYPPRHPSRHHPSHQYRNLRHHRAHHSPEHQQPPEEAWDPMGAASLFQPSPYQPPRAPRPNMQENWEHDTPAPPPLPQHELEEETNAPTAAILTDLSTPVKRRTDSVFRHRNSSSQSTKSTGVGMTNSFSYPNLMGSFGVGDVDVDGGTPGRGPLMMMTKDCSPMVAAPENPAFAAAASSSSSLHDLPPHHPHPQDTLGSPPPATMLLGANAQGESPFSTGFILGDFEHAMDGRPKASPMITTTTTTTTLFKASPMVSATSSQETTACVSSSGSNSTARPRRLSWDAASGMPKTARTHSEDQDPSSQTQTTGTPLDRPRTQSNDSASRMKLSAHRVRSGDASSSRSSPSRSPPPPPPPADSKNCASDEKERARAALIHHLPPHQLPHPHKHHVTNRHPPLHTPMKSFSEHDTAPPSRQSGHAPSLVPIRPAYYPPPSTLTMISPMPSSAKLKHTTPHLLGSSVEKENKYHHRPPFPERQAPPQRPPPCKCKKSKCLKLYCDCFGANLFCQGCRCTDCHNTPAFESERNKAIRDISSKNPNAFKPRLASGTTAAFSQGVVTGRQHNMGCKCSKTGCLKKYCECFKGGILCCEKCKCVKCDNRAGSQKLIDARRKMKDDEGARFAMKAAHDVWRGQNQQPQPPKTVEPPLKRAPPSQSNSGNRGSTPSLAPAGGNKSSQRAIPHSLLTRPTTGSSQHPPHRDGPLPLGPVPPPHHHHRTFYPSRPPHPFLGAHPPHHQGPPPPPHPAYTPRAQELGGYHSESHPRNHVSRYPLPSPPPHAHPNLPSTTKTELVPPKVPASKRTASPNHRDPSIAKKRKTTSISSETTSSLYFGPKFPKVPRNVAVHIFSFLDHAHLHRDCALVSKAWKGLAETGDLWRLTPSKGGVSV